MRPREAVQPDRFLVLGEGLFDTLHDMASQVGALMRLRFERGLARPVERGQMPDRLRQLLRESSDGLVRVIVDSTSSCADFDLAAMQGAERVRLYAFDRQASTVFASLSAPETEIKRRWYAHQMTGRLDIAGDEDFRLAYEFAFDQWLTSIIESDLLDELVERAARSSDAEAFAATYVANSINSKRLLRTAEDGTTQAADSVLAWARSLSMSADAAVAALRALLMPQGFPAPYGASTSGRPRTAREQSAKGGYYTLTVSAAYNDPNAFYLLVRIDEQHIAIARKREVTVRIGERSYMLGPIDENGVAEMEVLEPLPKDQGIEVSFGGREGDPDVS